MTFDEANMELLDFLGEAIKAGLIDERQGGELLKPFIDLKKEFAEPVRMNKQQYQTFLFITDGYPLTSLTSVMNSDGVACSELEGLNGRLWGIYPDEEPSEDDMRKTLEAVLHPELIEVVE